MSGSGLRAVQALAVCYRDGLDPPPESVIVADVERALAEDIGEGDLSAALLPDDPAQARIVCREAAVLAGLPWALRCFAALDPEVRFEVSVRDGERLAADTVFLRVHARSRALVSAERCALNFLQTLSGTATVAAEYAAIVASGRTRVLDTRKTLPGLRLAQKYAVRAGGAGTHRIGLFDAVLIKENHIAAAGSIAAAVAAARSLGRGRFIEVEVENIDELRQALAAGAGRIMLDEFDWDELREAVQLAQGRAELEVSGSMDQARLSQVAALGVDYVSVGALTKHVRAIDLSMRIEG